MLVSVSVWSLISLIKANSLELHRQIRNKIETLLHHNVQKYPNGNFSGMQILYYCVINPG